MSRTYVASRLVLDTGVATATVATGDDSGDAVAGRFAARVVSVTVDFGANGANKTVTSVTGVPWVKTSPRPLAQVVGRPNVSGSDDEDVLLQGVTALVTNIVDGVSFDVVAYSPEGANGIFTVQILGV